MEEKVVKGYKVFEPDWTCRPEGKIFQYEVGKTYEENLKPKVCERGFHFCEKAVDCFKYYEFNPKNKVAEVLALGEIDSDGIKSCTNKIQILREIPWAELLEIVNTGHECTGLGNSGDSNSGNRNSGDSNSGDYNSGDSNDGDSNSGNHNSGNRNSGSFNSGDCNSGDSNNGDYNSGNHNNGDCNSGDSNDGDYNSGNRNSGNSNSGSFNSGDYNSGNSNSGSFNSGNYNSGSFNDGDYNSGNHNNGDYNKCNFSSGCFNTVSEEKKIYMFNKLSEWTLFDWHKSEAYKLLDEVKQNITFIKFSAMTAEEKTLHPEAETTGGYLKIQNDNQNYIDWWHSLGDDQKAVITALPNFDKDIFKEITGIDVDY